MKSNFFLLLSVFLLGFSAVKAQQKTSMSLQIAVTLALEKSNEVGLANAKLATKRFQLQVVKNNQYPDFKISGQYLRLTNASIDLKTSSNSSGNSGGTPKVNQLLLGQATISMPLFSGFKLFHSIAASENVLQAEEATASYTKEETAMKVITYYANLYKAQKAVELYNESLKSAQQRVFDFTALEKNGIIARNELLKSQLQVSKIQLSLDEAEKNVKLLNNYLVQLLKLSNETQIEVSPNNIDPNLFFNVVKNESDALESRKDLQAIRCIAKANESATKVAKGNYYPSVSIVGGYTTLNLQNVVTVENAMNIGIGISYNLSAILKDGQEVKVAKSKVLETQKQEEIATDAIKLEIVTAKEEYALAIKQNKVFGEAVIQASENYRVVKDKYDNGLAETKDLLEADVEELSSKVNEAYAKANVALKYYELLNTTGQVLQAFNLTKN